MQRASNWLSATQGGTAIPVPMIFDFLIAAPICVASVRYQPLAVGFQLGDFRSGADC
jgi:hypothetical protein